MVKSDKQTPTVQGNKHSKNKRYGDKLKMRKQQAKSETEQKTAAQERQMEQDQLKRKEKVKAYEFPHKYSFNVCLLLNFSKFFHQEVVGEAEDGPIARKFAEYCDNMQIKFVFDLFNKVSDLLNNMEDDDDEYYEELDDYLTDWMEVYEIWCIGL